METFKGKHVLILWQETHPWARTPQQVAPPLFLGIMGVSEKRMPQRIPWFIIIVPIQIAIFYGQNPLLFGTNQSFG
jgi:hypothetical protein